MVGSRYQLLLRLAEEKQGAAAERLAQAQAALMHAKAKFDQLTDFVTEYRARLIAQGAAGIGIGQWQDFQRFLLRLNEAVHIQQGQVDAAMQRFLLERQGWQEASKTCKIFVKLLMRANERMSRQEARQEQKLTDELAARCVGDMSRDNY